MELLIGLNLDFFVVIYEFVLENLTFYVSKYTKNWLKMQLFTLDADII
jgi:hypothetical protein